MLTFSTKNRDYIRGGYDGLMVVKAWLSSRICLSTLNDKPNLSLYVLFLPVSLHYISL